jgi:hypothetical protein
MANKLRGISTEAASSTGQAVMAVTSPGVGGPKLVILSPKMTPIAKVGTCASYSAFALGGTALQACQQIMDPEAGIKPEMFVKA